MVKKRHVTLLELIIAIGLTTTIMTSVMYFYHQLVVVNQKMDAAENNAFKMLYVENRLANILPKTASATDKDVKFVFFTSGDSLIFTFDNGVKLDKDMSCYVIGRLCMDEKKRFILATWPAKKRWVEGQIPQMKKEILMENVDSVEFRFFVPPEKGKKNKDEGWPLGEGGTWISEWPKDVKKTPPLVKIILTRTVEGKKEVLNYAFHLPNTSKPITFD